MSLLIDVKDALELGLIFTRVIAIFLSFPLINTQMIPLNVKLLLVVTFSFFIALHIDTSFDIESVDAALLGLLVIKELFIGFALGLLVNIFISALSYAAEIISYFMGLTVVNVFDPTFGQISVLNRFFILLFYFIFFITESYRYVFGGIVASFEYIPIDKLVFLEPLFPYILEKSAYIFIMAFQIAFPFALILFLLNVALALVNRLIPQINVFIVGLPMQIYVGLAALAFGSSVLVYIVVSLLQRMGEEYIYILKLGG